MWPVSTGNALVQCNPAPSAESAGASLAAAESGVPSLQEPTHISVTTPGGEHVLVRSDPVQAGIEMNRSSATRKSGAG